MLVFSNLWGLFGLFAVPCILAVHFLRRKAPEVPVSTLFLFPKEIRSAESGARFERLESSIPLWMQLLASLLLTLLWMQPRWVSEVPVVKIAVVLDDSASMSVFQDEVRDALAEELSGLVDAGQSMELWVMTSDLAKPRLYAGNSLSEALSLLDGWSPKGGAQLPDAALRLARSLVGQEGGVIYLTDGPEAESSTLAKPSIQLSYGAYQRGVGYPVVNVGFTGVRYLATDDEVVWEASVKNHSDSAVTRTWVIEFEDGQRSEAQSLSLKPHELQTLSGRLPKGTQRAQVVLANDRFVMDDVLPLLRPRRSMLPLSFVGDVAESWRELLPRFERVVVQENGGAGMEVLQDLAQWSEGATPTYGLITLPSGEERVRFQALDILAEDHAFMRGLNWSKLLVSGESRFDILDSDQVLLWGNDEPLIFLRQKPSGVAGLVVNFSLERSNALNQEAFALLLYRYFEWVQQRLLKEQWEETEPMQTLALTPQGHEGWVTKQLKLSGEVTQETHTQTSQEVMSPSEVGFYEIWQGVQRRWVGANVFGDMREANFAHKKEHRPEIQNLSTHVVVQEQQGRRLWILLSMVAMLIAWYFATGRTKA